MGTVTVLYDDECGFCRWSAWALARWDRAGRLRFLPLRSPDAEHTLRHLSVEERFGSWHAAVGADVASGGAAVPTVLRVLPGGTPLAAIAARFPRAADTAYRWVADHRDRIGRLLGSKACAVDPGGCRRS